MAYFLLFYSITKNCCYIARDTYGVRPLFYYNEGKDVLFSSVLKSISKLLPNESKNKIVQFPPGKCQNSNLMKYINLAIRYIFSSPNAFPITYAKFNSTERIYAALDNAVKKRVFDTTEREIACLLSGGLLIVV